MSISFAILVIKYEEEFIILYANIDHIYKKLEKQPFYDYLREAFSYTDYELKDIDSISQALKSENTNKILSEHGFELGFTRNCKITK